jgi:hypothetical protein
MKQKSKIDKEDVQKINRQTSNAKKPTKKNCGLKLESNRDLQHIDQQSMRPIKGEKVNFKIYRSTRV